MEPILKVDNINVYYGSIHAIKGVSFEVNQGEIVTLIGANGAGKSTTLNTVAGLLHSKTGSICPLTDIAACAHGKSPPFVVIRWLFEHFNWFSFHHATTVFTRTF